MARGAWPRRGVRTSLPVAVRRAKQGALNAEAADWAARVTANGGSVSGSTAIAVSAFCDSVAAAGIRDRFYRLNLFAGSLGASIQSSGCVVPLYRGPSLSGTQYGNTTDTQNSFATTDYSDTVGLSSTSLSNKYLDTGLATSAIPASVYQSMHLSASHGPMAYPGDTDPYLLGAWNGATDRNILQTSLRSPGVGYESSRLGKTTLVTAVTGVSGSRPSTFLLSQRQSATSLQLYRNGSLDATAATSTTGIAGVTHSIYVFAINNTGTRLGGADAITMRHYSIGDDMTDSQVLAFYNALAAFNTAMGRTA